MARRIHLHRTHAPRPCRHECGMVRIAGMPGYGRCQDCNATVATPGIFPATRSRL